MKIELHYYQVIKSPTIPAIYLKYIHHNEPLKSEGAWCIFRVIVQKNVSVFRILVDSSGSVGFRNKCVLSVFENMW